MIGYSKIRLKSVSLICIFWLICILTPVPQKFAYAEPISVGVAVGSALALSATLSSYQYLKCKWYECCNQEWVKPNFTNLKLELQQKLYGQHFVTETVVRSLKAHLENKQPQKALVLSFHGWTGGGKNYVSDIIARNLFVKGSSSNFVRLFVPSLHFRDKTQSRAYAEFLQTSIRRTVESCHVTTLFLFDELDKIEPEVINALKPFIEYHKRVDKVDYSRSVFIFMSNTGGSGITEKAYEYWRKGKSREDMKLSEMEEIIQKAAFNEDGGLRYSDLIKSNLIDHFIPFLPLERSHVKLCIKDYFLSKKAGHSPSSSDPDDRTSQNVDQYLSHIVDQLQYFPRGVDLYSTSGCKRVSQKVDLFLEEQEENRMKNNENLEKSQDYL